MRLLQVSRHLLQVQEARALGTRLPHEVVTSNSRRRRRWNGKGVAKEQEKKRSCEVDSRATRNLKFGAEHSRSGVEGDRGEGVEGLERVACHLRCWGGRSKYPPARSYVRVSTPVTRHARSSEARVALYLELHQLL